MNKSGIEFYCYFYLKGNVVVLLGSWGLLKVLVVTGCCASPATKAPRKFTNETRESGEQ